MANNRLFLVHPASKTVLRLGRRMDDGWEFGWAFGGGDDRNELEWFYKRAFDVSGHEGLDGFELRIESANEPCSTGSDLPEMTLVEWGWLRECDDE